MKNLICIAVSLLFCSACNNSKTNHDISSYEVNVNGGDTCNRTVNGLKQGKWYVIDSVELRKGNKVITDTVYYKDGKAAEK